MKKLLAIVLAVLSAFSVTAVAYAETTTLTTTVPDAAYTLNIPADQEIVFGRTSTTIGTVTVTNATGFAVGKNLNVTLTHTSFTCPDVSTTIPFNIIAHYGTGYDRFDIGANLITFPGMSTGELSSPYQKRASSNDGGTLESLSVDIASEDWGKALGGDYSATITFTAEVVVED